MTDFKKSYPAGRMIARLFAQVGWAITLVGVLLAVTGGVIGAVPGTGGAEGPVGTIARVAATMPGLGLALFGLFSVMMAAQTRATIDSADIAREMLALARRRPAGVSAAPLPVTAPREAEAPVPVEAAAEAEDDIPDMPAATRPRFAAAPRAEARPEVARPVAKEEGRAEPVFVSAPKAKPAPGKIHPIFSARPPR